MAKSNDSLVVMDSRKFLGALNDSAQSKVAEFENHIEQMGKKAGKDWRLVALRSNDLFFEDCNTNTYYIAEHKTDKGKVNIQNIRGIEIQEGEKQKVYADACLKLVNAIEENDQSGMQSAFGKMKSHKFSGRVVPHSGFVRCRDNVVRQVRISSDESLSEDVKNRLIGAIVEGLQDQVIVEDGQVVSASFSSGDQVKLPVTKWGTRKLVAKRMRSAAENAYWSEGFQTRVRNTAQLVSEGKIENAVKFMTPFLNEMEEFTLLSRDKVQTLIENALAAKAIFNQALCNDVATLFHRTNLKINRRKIIDEWRNIAKRSENAVLAENVTILEEAKNFEPVFDKFLNLIFEAISNKEVTAEALATTLEVLKNKTPKIRESHDLTSKLDNLIVRLKDPSFDDAAIYEAEDLIATIKEELAATETLGDFDQIPGGEEDLGLDELAADEGGGDSPVININSPLIQIGGQSSASGADDADDLGGEELGGGLDELGGGEEEMGLGEDDGQELADLLGGDDMGGDELGQLGLEGKRRGKAIKESNPQHYEMRQDGDDDQGAAPDDEGEDLDESADPYAIRAGEFNFNDEFSVASYGAPVITDQNQLQQIVGIMNRLAVEHKLAGEALAENLESMAEASIQAIGLRIPTGRMPKALEEAISLFNEMTSTAGVADFTSGGDDEVDDEMGLGDDDDLGEDQFKGPRIRGRGFKKTAYKPRELKNESIEWLQSQDDARLGSIDGVKFIFDHGGTDESLKPIIMSEDASVEIPIPEDLYDSAMASAELIEGDSSEFMGWLYESIEQLRPITDEEDKALEEAMAKITTTPDGGLSVEVSDDVNVDDLGEVDGEEVAGMEPVDAVDPGMEDEMGGVEGEEGVEEMPDYEEGMDDEMGAEDPGMGGEDPMGGGDPGMGAPGGMEPAGGMGDEMSGEEEEEPRFEDKDVTEPSSSKYTKHVKDNKRDMPPHNMPKASDDKLDSVGPDLKTDDGSGTKPPTAKSMSQK